jgi:hypothetical protein
LGCCLGEYVLCHQSEVNSCKDNYLHDIDYLVSSHFSERSFPSFEGPTPDDFTVKVQGISNAIGWVFADHFESLITMPKGNKVVPMNTQLNECLESLEFKPVGKYFEKGVDKTVYYCAGYLGHAGATAASNGSTDLGKCIGGISIHVATTEEAAAIVKRGLPEG